MSEVFVLNISYDYEGESTLGVFSTLEAAWEYMIARGQDYDQWEYHNPGDIREGNIPISMGDYFIRRMPVDAKYKPWTRRKDDE